MCLYWVHDSWVCNCIAKAKKPFTIGEKLILPAAKDIYHELLGEAAVQKDSMCSDVSGTVTRWTDEIGGSWGTIVREDWWITWYSSSCLEVTNIGSRATVLVLGPLIFQEDVLEGYVVCTFVASQRQQLLKLSSLLNDYISGKLNWSFCVGIYCRWSGCHDWTFWLYYSGQRDCFWI